jgi:hypothetical protein
MSGLEIFWQQIDMARINGADTDVIFRRFSRARSKQPKQPVEMPTFNFGPRQTFTELRPRHLTLVEEYGVADTYNRDELREHFLTNWNRLFGALRKSKAHEVPSDDLRKSFMISDLLDLIELRREEVAANVLPGGLATQATT